MSKAEILAELPSLSPEALSEVQAKLDELMGRTWLASANLSDMDKKILEEALADYELDPDAGISWEDVKSKILNELKR